ncbi:MAG: hypothetical protein ACT4PS_19305 [Betaproteobacteria bacterium]
MEETWKSVAVMSDAELRRKQGLCGKEQQELTGFVLAFTSDVSPEALGLVLYAHLVVIEAFRRSGAEFRNLKANRVEDTWKGNFAFINDLKAAGHRRAPFQLSPKLSSEPFVMQYVIDALTEQDESDPVALTDDDFWRIMQVLKTVADCMHFARKTK